MNIWVPTNFNNSSFLKGNFLYHQTYNLANISSYTAHITYVPVTTMCYCVVKVSDYSIREAAIYRRHCTLNLKLEAVHVIQASVIAKPYITYINARSQ